ncbi:MAG: hypothetical protein ACOX9C_13070 [Kiritimatiellia bacterium]|jgi:hypothetical protein
MKTKCFFAHVVVLLCLGSLVFTGCLTTDIGFENVVLTLHNNAVVIDGNEMPFDQVGDALRKRSQCPLITVVFSSEKDLPHGILYKVRLDCSSLGIFDYAFLVDGKVVPVRFEEIGEGPLWILEKYGRNNNSIEIVINPDNYIVQDKTFSSDKDFHKFLAAMDTKDKAIVFICSMKSKHGQLLDVIEILSRETPKDFFVLSKD